MALLMIAGMGVAPAPAAASTYWQTIEWNAAVVIETARGNLSGKQEAEQINENWEEWRASRVQAGQQSVGQVSMTGVYPVAEYSPCELGRVEVLTYFFIDPLTGLPTTVSPGFVVASVRYEALMEPFTMDETELSESSIRAHLTVLGVSADAGSDFALPFQLDGFEPIILAFPLDAMGNEIPGEGTAGFASHVLNPRADYNADGFVDGIDYDSFNNDFEMGDSRADYNGDGFVDGIDYDSFNNDFEAGC